MNKKLAELKILSKALKNQRKDEDDWGSLKPKADPVTKDDESKFKWENLESDTESLIGEEVAFPMIAEVHEIPPDRDGNESSGSELETPVETNGEDNGGNE